MGATLPMPDDDTEADDVEQPDTDSASEDEPDYENYGDQQDTEPSDDRPDTEAEAEAVADGGHADTDTDTDADAEDSTDAEDTDADGEADADADDSNDEGNSTLGSAADPRTSPQEDAAFIVKARVLTEWLEYPDALVDEAKIHLTEAGFETTAVDPANVGMVNTDLDATAFESYDLGSEGIIGVNLTRLTSVLSGANADDLVQIDYEAETRNLVIRYGGHTFRVALIDPDSIRKEPDIPDLDLDATVEVAADTLDTGIGYATDVADNVKLAVDGETFTIHAEGDTDDYTFDSGDAATDDVTVTRLADVTSLYSGDYLTDMMGPFDDQTITIDLGQEFPLKMNAAITDDDVSVGSVEFMLAPRIQSE